MTTHTVNLVLWSVQIFLALFFVGAGAPKLLGQGMERWTGFSEMPRAQVIFIGIAEVAGALALVLPMATRTVEWLTPWAAIGLAIVVLMAAGFHLRANERLNAVETVLWAGIAGVIAIGRWNLVAELPGIPAWLLVVAPAVLVPAAIINVIVLLRRPLNDSAAAALGVGSTGKDKRDSAGQAKQLSRRTVVSASN